MSIDIKLNSTPIVPEFPLELAITVSLTPEERNEIKAVSIRHDDLVLSIEDAQHDVIFVSEAHFSRYLDMRHSWHADVSEGHAQTSFVFNEWCSTNLSSGEYIVRAELAKVGKKPIDSITYAYDTLDPPLRWEMPLKVLPRNDDLVRRRYEELLENLKHYDRRNAGARAEALHAAELVAYARGPLARPYQLRMIEGEVPAKILPTMLISSGHMINLAENLIHEGDPEVAKQLIALLEQGKIQDRWLRQLSRWIVHQMHEQGPEALKQATEEFVKKDPVPHDPRPVPGLDNVVLDEE